MAQKEEEQKAEQEEIKQAIIPQDTAGAPPDAQENPDMTQELVEDQMSPSLLSSPQGQAPQNPLPGEEAEQENLPQYSPSPPGTEQDQTQEYDQPPQQPGGGYNEYSQYDDGYGGGQYSAGLSPDTITEIAEQAITERISPIKDQLDKIIDMRNTFSTEITHISDRLERIEKIIDRLQLSLLQKVGEYVTNVDDIKKELVQTQKSFKALTRKSQGSKSRARP